MTFYDPFSRETFDDPYPIYERLRAEFPLYHSPDLNFWALSRAEDIQPVLQDHARFSNVNGVDLDGGDTLIGDGNFLDEDPPRHDVLRKIVHTAFSVRTVAALADYVQLRVGDLLHLCEEAREFDFVETFSASLPLAVICHILGVPATDHDRVADLVHGLSSRDVGRSVVPARALEARYELADYFTDLARKRRDSPQDDVLSHVAHAEVEGQPLEETTIVGIVLILFLAGSETVSNLLSNTVWNLEHNPEQRALLYAEEVDAARAVEELVRFDAPIQNTMRTVTADTELHGAIVPAGARLLLIVASANRDERRFNAAATLDFAREPRRHMGFGYGIHFCIGAPLARLQTRIVLDAWVRRGVWFEPRGPGERRTKVDSRGFASLPVSLVSRTS